jgi:hypothetical protein
MTVPQLADLARWPISHRLALPLGLPLVICLLSFLFLSACPGETGSDGTTGGPKCDVSRESGIWLLPFGKLSQEIYPGGQATVAVMVLAGGSLGVTGEPVAGRSVQFAIITQGAGVSLDQQSVTTDSQGLARASIMATDTAKAHLAQVQASTGGTCNQTFSVDIQQSLRQLRAVSPSPYDTFTGSRVAISVEATTNGYAKLAGEEILFSLDAGKTAETLFSPVNGSATPAATLKVRTGANGRATAMLATGASAISQLKVLATLSGTAPAEIIVRVADGQSAGCNDTAQCPLGYECKNQLCEPVTTPGQDPGGGANLCKDNSDCPAGFVCNSANGQCLKGTGKTCDPIEGTGCGLGEVCVVGQCAGIPGGCKNNEDCPDTFICKEGACVPQGQPPAGGCVVPSDCPSAQTCVNGDCKPKSVCNIVHNSDRLKGNWTYDSTLELREALSSFSSVFLKAAEYLRDIINGDFDAIKTGLGSLIDNELNKLVGKFAKSAIDQFIPPWGQSLIRVLGDISDILDDLRVVSSVKKTSVGPDAYLVSEQWDLVEFEFQKKKISSPPSAIPQIGQVKIPDYSATEVCGVLFLAKHTVSNVLGGVIKWVIDTAFSAVTCSISGAPCYSSLDEALDDVLDCDAIAFAIDDAVFTSTGGDLFGIPIPPLDSLFGAVCKALKASLLKEVKDGLGGIETKLSLLKLSGAANIPNPGQDTKLEGEWNGTLGSGVFKGDFQSPFKATRNP